MKSPSASIYHDVAESPRACCRHEYLKRPGEAGFLDQFFKEHEIAVDEKQLLLEHLQRESDRVVSERFARLVQFFQMCRIPKLVVFSILVTRGQMQQVKIAEQCGVSKQAVNAAFREMEPVFKRYVNGFEHRRNFSNGRNHQIQNPNEHEETNPQEVNEFD